MNDLLFMSAVEQARLIRSCELNPEDLVVAYLEQIARLDPELNAFVTIAAEEALGEAKKAGEAAAAGGELPPFCGVPIPIKDLTETRGVRTTFSTATLARFVPDYDAYVVRRIKRAGFIVIGKTNTPELGTIPMTESDLNGVCRNPWDTQRTPGGSSGGAAVAVATGMAPLAHGSDGGGSVRIPASCCGLFGIKPARGRVSSGPRVGESIAGFSSSGPIARSVADAAALLDVMSGYEVGDPCWAPEPIRPFAEETQAEPGRLRIAFTVQAPTGVPVDPECVAAARDAAGLLESLGHDVFEAAPDWEAPEVAPLFIKIWQTLAANTGFDDPSVFEPVNRALTESAFSTSSIEYIRALTELHRLSRRVVAFWDDVDVLLTPTLALPPVEVGWIREQESDPWAQLMKAGFWVAFTPMFNMTGQPAVSVPLFWNEAGLPIGVQLAGRPAGEATLIRLSAQLERARPWAHRIPPAYARPSR